MNLWQPKLTEEKSHEIKDMKDIYIQITPQYSKLFRDYSKIFKFFNRLCELTANYSGASVYEK